LHAGGVTVLKINPFERCNQIDAGRRVAKLDYSIRDQEVLDLQTE
jgi:hypothetical protein